MAERDNNYNRDNQRRNRNNRRQERKEEKVEEPKVEVNEARNIGVELGTNIGRTVSGTGDLDSKKNQIIADLSIVNNMLVDFYDSQLNSFGAQGFVDEQGRAYSATNYTTPEEKLVALEGIIYYSKDRTQSFTEAFNKTQTVIKEQREKLKNKAIKLLDDNKELINENKKLINDAKVEIANDKEQSKKLDINILEEKNKADAALTKQKFAESKIKEIKAELEKLREKQADISMEIKNAKEDDAHAQATGKKKNSPQAGYYNTKGKELESLTREIQQKENFISDFDAQVIDFKTEYANAMNSAKSIEQQRMNLDASIAKKEKNLETLENKNSELKKKLNATIEPLEQAFDENVVGMYKNDQRLNYEKDSSLNKDEKDKTEEPQEEKEQTEEENEKEHTGANGGTTPSELPADVTEEQLSRNFINNFARNTSDKDRKAIFNGPGYANLVLAMENATGADKRNLRDALLDMKYDLEEDIPDRYDFINKMGRILPAGEFDLDELYDNMFSEDKRGDIHISNFSKLNREELREMQKVLNKFEKLKADGNLTVEQAKIFEENFAKYAKMGSLLETGKGNGIFGGFKRLFNGDMYNMRKRFSNSLSDYTDSNFEGLNAQYSKHNSFLSQLGKSVEDTPKYKENRGDVSNSSRTFRKQVEDGRMNYR